MDEEEVSRRLGYHREDFSGQVVVPPTIAKEDRHLMMSERPTSVAGMLERLAVSIPTTEDGGKPRTAAAYRDDLLRAIRRA